jgi:Xaa-Pro aminopeptidase
MSESGLEALLISDLANLRYLSGFTGSNGALLMLAADEPLLFTDGRYTTQAVQEAPDLQLRTTREIPAAVLSSVPSASLAAETHVLSVDSWRELDCPSASGRLVEQLRRVKDDDEIEALTKACAMSVESLKALTAEPLVGCTEIQIARELHRLLLDAGAEDLAFDTIVASGPNSAIAHHQPTSRCLGPNELLKIDFGARYAGYHADCTRSFVTGTPDGFQSEIHDVVRRSQAAGVAALVEGVAIGEAFHAAVDVLDDAGWREAFTTGLGHGVGLQIHEDPYFASDDAGTLERRTVLTMEPGIYVPGRGGVRIEDTVVVTGDGPQVLTPLTTTLQEIA